MLVTLAMIACTLVPPGPVVESVAPAWGWTGETTDVLIEGQRFFPSIEVDAAFEGGGRVDGTFLAWIETDPPTALGGVEHQGYDGLRAEIPAGLPVGTFDVRIRTPAGVEAVLEDGFEVTETRADHLDLEVGTAAYSVGETARLLARVHDPANAVVPESMLVEVRAASSTGASGVVFLDGGLEDQVPLADGNGIRGRLGPAGSATLLVRSDMPDDVTFRISAADEDSVVAPDALLLSWAPGAVAEIVVELPYDGFQATAGATYSVGLELRDAFGNVLEDESVDALVYEACGNWRQSVTVDGRAEIQATSTVACADNAIYVFASGLSAESDVFAVRPGPAQAYGLTPSPSEVVAGEDGLVLLVEALDAWGNRVEQHDASVVLRDSLGGLDSSAGVGSARCPGFPAAGEAVQLCEVGLWRAGTVTVSAEDADGRTGTSGPVRVTPADPFELRLVPSSTEVAAGEAFGLTPQALDRYGNTITLDAATVVLRDDTGTLDCSPDADAFLCTVTRASDSVSIEVEALGLVGGLDSPLRVTNGVLAAVDILPRASRALAGDPFTVEVRAWDAYGNPYVVQDDPSISLRDSTGTLDPATVELDADGTAAVEASVTRASEGTVLTASRSGVDLGSGGPVRIDPGDAVELVIDVPAWAEVGTEDTVSVIAVDVFGNLATGHEGPFSMTASAGACASVAGSLVGGAATVTLTCDVRHVGEQLRVRDASFDVTSDPFDVLDLGCPSGPEAVLLADGADEVVVCLDDTVTLDASASLAGDEAIVAWHFDDGVDVVARLETGASTATYVAPGRFVPVVVAVDADACASEATATVWAGPDDGGAVGPVRLTPSSSSAATGSGVTVDVRATDCAGAVASGAALATRADLGTVSGAASGAGLEVVLDGSGRARLNWVFSADHAATATLLVGTADGAAFGQESISVSGDGVLPRVTRVDPAGATENAVAAVDVTFTEALLGSSVNAASVSLTGPDGAETTTLALSDDGRTLTVTPSRVLDGAVGTWTLRLSGAVRDLGGNRLDGAYTGVPAAFEASFGAVAAIGAYPDGCASDVARFVPDGDVGTAEEADAVEISFGASGTASRWAWWVTDPDGDVVRNGSAASADRSITWDGRADDGRVVESGTYLWSVAAVDAYAALSDACQGTVSVDQHLEAP